MHYNAARTIAFGATTVAAASSEALSIPRFGNAAPRQTAPKAVRAGTARLVCRVAQNHNGIVAKAQVLDVEVDRAAQKLMTASCTVQVAEAVVAALTDAGQSFLGANQSILAPREKHAAIAQAQGCNGALLRAYCRRQGFQASGIVNPAAS